MKTIFLLLIFISNNLLAEYRNEIIASVNRTAITSDDLENLKKNRIGSDREALIQELIFLSLIKEEAKRLKVSVTAAESKQYPDLNRDEILKQKLAKRIFQNEIQVSSKEINKQIKKLALNSSSKLINLLQITIDQKDIALANKIKRVKTPTQFAAIAQHFSQDSFASLGGNVGLLKESDLNPQVVKLLTNLNPGEISRGLVNGQQITFFYLLKRLTTEEDVSNYFRTKLAQDKFQNKISEYFSKDIYEKHQITIF